MSNHLGNILVTVSDKKLKHNTEDHYYPDVINFTDYYAFGMAMPNRTGYVKMNSATPSVPATVTDNAGESYRYAFNGKEADRSEWNTGTVYDYGFRIYDARVCRFLSVDPLTKSYPMLTPYQFASNTPIQAIDLDGLESASYLIHVYVDKTTNKVIKKEEVATELYTKDNVGQFGQGVYKEIRFYLMDGNNNLGQYAGREAMKFEGADEFVDYSNIIETTEVVGTNAPSSFGLGRLPDNNVSIMGYQIPNGADGANSGQLTVDAVQVKLDVTIGVNNGPTFNFGVGAAYVRGDRGGLFWERSVFPQNDNLGRMYVPMDIPQTFNLDRSSWNAGDVFGLDINLGLTIGISNYSGNQLQPTFEDYIKGRNFGFGGDIGRLKMEYFGDYDVKNGTIGSNWNGFSVGASLIPSKKGSLSGGFTKSDEIKLGN